MKRILSLFIAVSVALLSCITVTAAAGELVIIYTNDTHCEVGGELGFADISAIEAMEEARGNSVIILDAGDAVQGGAIGAVSKGGYIIDIMNKIGYDFAAVGNHEFDYGVPRLKELREQADYPYVCSNIMDLEENKLMFDAYFMVSPGDTDIAFVAVTTPNTVVDTAPEYFKNESGEFIYDFSGENLYDTVQKTIDEVIEKGADIVIGVTHMGTDDADAPYTSKALIANTIGFDALIDAHSHTVINGERVKDKKGEEVILTSTGSKFANIGTMRINGKGEISVELIDEAYKAEGLSKQAQAAYDDSMSFIEGIKAEYSAELEKVVAKTEYDLTVNNPDKFSEETGVYREVRRGETNMGNFCADAYRAVTDADIAIINGGGVRADINKGDVTYGDLLNVNPFGNELCIIEATGAQILDALEHGARSYPMEEGAFLQVSGITYEIDENVKSTVLLDDKGLFKEVSGERRVKNVKVDGESITANKKYTFAGSSFTLLNGGDGFTMFEGCTVINNSVCSDIDALIKYIDEDLKGVIGDEYANPLGEGRIKNYTASEDVAGKAVYADVENHWAEEKIKVAAAAGLVNGISENAFVPDGNITRAMFVTILHRLEHSPVAEINADYADVPADAYYSDAAAWAKENGIMEGMGNNAFAPDVNITREQMAAAIMRYCVYKEKGPHGAWAVRLDYADLEEASQWAVEPMMFNKINGIMTGDNANCFNPKSNATRAEAVVTILRASDYIN